ncbi:MAG: molybdopterin-dependent oxidoreductase, partial [Myxococcales bacterium]|nr:molybdopterin-dependent oxidoreductase [Myxococcales bacterium]
TGHLGIPNAGMNPLRGQNNVQGANDAGASPIYYPGYQRVDDPEAQERWEAAWGVPLSPEPGLNLNVMMKGLRDGRIRGLYVMGEDILVSEPNASALEEGLNNAEFIVVQDILPTETMRFADVVLPAACFAEKDGVFTNTDRRVQRVRKAVEPPGEARADWQILCDMARAVGYPMPDYAHPGAVYAEMASNSPMFAGIRHERIGAAGLQWPCPEPGHPGTPTLHVDGPKKGKATFMPAAYRPSEELADDAFPLVLSTGRTLYHYNAGTQTRRANGASTKQPGNFIEMHRYDARKRGLANGDRVEVSSRRGAIEAEVVVSPRMRVGCVWMPMHFPEQLTNRLTTDAGDTVTGTAEYKVCAVQVSPLAAAK